MYSHILLMLSFSVLNTSAPALTNITDININQNSIETVSIQTGRITQNSIYIPTDSFKYYLEYSLVEKTNLDLKLEIKRIEEEEKKAREEQERKEAEEKARQEEARLAAIRKEEEAKKQLFRQQQAKQKVTATQTKQTPVASGSIPDRIRYWAGVYGIDGERAIRIGQCESGLNPSAKSGSGLYGGIFQQSFQYWPARAANAGLPGSSIFDAEANIKVSVHMMATQGFYHWPVCSSR